jgi:anti-sigma-K factor RskA
MSPTDGDTPLSHDAGRELLAGYALGALTPEDATALQQLLDDWPEGRRELRDLIETTLVLNQLAPDTTPPLGLEGRIVTAARKDRSTEPAWLRRRPQAPLWRRFLPHTLAASFAVAAIILGLLNFTADETPQGVWHSVTSESAAFDAGAVQAYIVHPGESPSAVFFSQLDPAPENRQYQLWLLLDDGSVTAAGSFNSTGPADRPAVWVGGLGAGPVVGFAVSQMIVGFTPRGEPRSDDVLFTFPSN